MAKQFRGNQRGRKRSTIHTNEGRTRSLGSFVNGAGDEFFACTGFPGNQNGGAGRSDFGNSGENGLQRPRCADNFLEHRSLVDLLAKGNVLLLKFLFGSLALINIRRRNIPTLDLSLVVVERIVTNQEPAIIPIRAPHSQLQLVSGATGASTIGISACRPFPVIRMNEPTGKKKISGCLPPLFKTKADVIEPNAVGIKTFTIGSKYRNMLRRQVQHLPELHFTSAPFLLCSFTLRDVDHRAHKFNEMARRAQNRMTYDVNVPDGAIRMHDAVVRHKLRLLADSRLGYFP